jgi:hypothetical protein
MGIDPGGTKALQHERFGQVPASVTADPRLSASAVRVYAALAAYADKHGDAWPGQDQLARDAALDDARYIRQHLHGLVEHGYVTVERRGRGHTNRYHMTGGKSSAHTVPTADMTGGKSSALDRLKIIRSIGEQTIGTDHIHTLTPHGPEKTTKGRKPDALFEAICAACDWHDLTASAGALVDHAVRELHRVSATPEDVESRAARWRSTHNFALTPSGLARQWASLAGTASLRTPDLEVHVLDDSSIRAAEERQAWAAANPEEATRDRQAAQERMAAVRDHLPRPSEECADLDVAIPS